MATTSTLASAEPFLIAAGYAAIVGSLNTWLVKKAAKNAVEKRPPIDLPGGTAENFVAFSLWALDLSQVITTAFLSPLIAFLRGSGYQLLYVASVVLSVVLCGFIWTQDPVEYVTWSDRWFERIEEKRRSGHKSAPGIVVQSFVRVITALGITWPAVIQLVAAGIAASASGV